MDLKSIIFKKRSAIFWAANVIVILLCYGFELTNSSINIDDDAIREYLSYSSLLMASGRYGLYIINAVFRLDYLPFFYLALGLMLMIFGNHIYTSFFEIISGGQFDEKASIIFSVIALSAPVYMYKMIFAMNCFQMGIVYACASLALTFLYKVYASPVNKKSIWNITAPVLLICFCLSNNETTLIDIMIMFIFTILLSDAYTTVENNKITVSSLKKYIRPILRVAAVVMAGIVLWKVLGILIIKALDISPYDYLGGYISYNSNNFIKKFTTLIYKTLSYYKNNPWVLAANSIMAAMLAVFCILSAKKRRDIYPILAFPVIIVLSFFMPIVTGNASVLQRTKNYLAVFNGLCMASGYIVLKDIKIKNTAFAKAAFMIFFFVLSFYRAKETCLISFSAYTLSELDIDRAYSIYEDIQKYDTGEVSLPIVFVGEPLSNFILPVDNKLLGYKSKLGYGNKPEMYSVLGINMPDADPKVKKRAVIDSFDMAAYPAEGYIRKTDYAIIVKLGEVSVLKAIDYSTLKTENAGERIRYSVDSFDPSDKFNAGGWAFMDKNLNGKVFFFIRNTEDNSTYIINCARSMRRDVTNALDDGLNHDKCGFGINKCDISSLPSGEYSVSFAIYYDGTYYISDYNNSFVK